MQKLIAQLNVTPDGFCGHEAVIADDELHDFASQLLKTADTALFGRISYQMMEDYWPVAAKDTSLPKAVFDFANAIDRIDKIVFSRTLKKVNWHNATILSQLDKATILNLKQQARGPLITGSPALISQLAAMELIDEYYFLIHPIIAGRGKRLFDISPLTHQQNMKLAGSTFFKSGVVVLHYQYQPED